MSHTSNNEYTPYDPSHLDITLFTCYSDEELRQHMRSFEESLEEMRVWDIEDAKNKASGTMLPGVNPPAQPYRESHSFKELTHWVHHIETIQRQRTNCDTEEEVSKDCDDEDKDNNEDSQPLQSLLPPQLTPPSLHCTLIHNLDAVDHLCNLSPPDIREPLPFPPSPNIITRPNLQKLYSLPNRRSPDICAPQPLPLKPNIPAQSTVVLDVRG